MIKFVNIEYGDDEIDVEVDFSYIECKSTSEAGNVRVTREWDEIEINSISHNGEHYEFNDIPETGWAGAFLRALVDGDVNL